MNVPWVTALELRQLRAEALEYETDCEECHLVRLLAEQCEQRDQEIQILQAQLRMLTNAIENNEEGHVRLGWSSLLLPT